MQCRGDVVDNAVEGRGGRLSCCGVSVSGGG
jgi:hypothetical protein